MTLPPSSADAPSRRLLVVDYDPSWPEVFAALQVPIRRVLRGLAVSVEHVGSTSVPGLAAKPVIDLDVIVASRADVPTAIERLAALHYVHEGDLGIEDREALRSPPGLPAHHLYVCVQGTAALANHLAIRDRLRADATTAAAYGQLKKELAAQYPHDAAAYTAAKSGFLLRLLREAGWSDRDLTAIRMANRSERG